MTNKFYIVLAGQVDKSTEYKSAPQAWEALSSKIREYVRTLWKYDSLFGQAAEWDAFADDAFAISLRPWVNETTVSGPDGEWYGVIKGEK